MNDRNVSGRRTLTFGLTIALTIPFVATIQSEDWPCWRGSQGNNHASAETDTPIRWNVDTGENILWKTAIPGRGHSTPVVVDQSIFLTTADHQEKTQSVLKFDRQNGIMTDQWVLHQGTLPQRIHPNNSYASPTPAFDGEHLFVSFHTDDSIWLTKLTTTGREVWKKRVAEFKPSRFQFGYGASPLIEEGRVIVAAEYDGPDSGLYALDCRTGSQAWKVPRPINLNFASPIAATIAGQRQILLAGAETITAYDPSQGKVLWSVDETTEAICGTVVWDDRRVIISGGNPDTGTWCVAGDGSKAKLWNNPVKCYEQSLLTIPGFVFGVADSGVAYCWRTDNGTEMWKKRLFGGGISASPYLVGDKIYVGSEAGTVYVFKASPDRFELLAENDSGDSMFASPVAVDNRLFLRTATGNNENRQEHLIAIGNRR